jgi:hypothetical protein
MIVEMIIYASKCPDQTRRNFVMYLIVDLFEYFKIIEDYKKTLQNIDTNLSD